MTDTMGQLQMFQTTDNVTVVFAYLGNSGLIESRDDVDGCQSYEYNDVGHVHAIVLTSGRRLLLSDGDVTGSGKLVTLATEAMTSLMTVGDSAVTIAGGNIGVVLRRRPFLRLRCIE